MRASQEEIDRRLEIHRLREAGKWYPDGWWRLVSDDGRLLAESSDEEEIRRFAARDGGTVQRHFQKIKQKWENA